MFYVIVWNDSDDPEWHGWEVTEPLEYAEGWSTNSLNAIHEAVYRCREQFYGTNCYTFCELSPDEAEQHHGLQIARDRLPGGVGAPDVLTFSFDEGLYGISASTVAHERAKYCANLKHDSRAGYNHDKWRSTYFYEYYAGMDSHTKLAIYLGERDWNEVENWVYLISPNAERSKAEQWEEVGTFYTRSEAEIYALKHPSEGLSDE